MNDLKFISEDYNLQNAKKYRMSIQVNPDGFSVFIAGEDGQVLKLIHRNLTNHAEIIQAFKEEEILREIPVLDFGERVLIAGNGLGSLVPADFCEPDYRKMIYSVDHPLHGKEEIRVSDKSYFGYRILYRLTAGQHQIADFFKNSPGLEHISQTKLELLEQVEENNVVFLYSTPSLLLISVKNKGKLLFHNTFPISSGNDIVYHTINCIRKLSVDVGSGNLIYAGDLAAGDEHLELLSRYLDKLEFYPNRMGFELAGNVNENYFIHLQQAVHCV